MTEARKRKVLPSVPYQDALERRLKDPVYATYYLAAIARDLDRGHKQRFRIALRDVAIAHGLIKRERK